MERYVDGSTKKFKMGFNIVGEFIVKGTDKAAKSFDGVKNSAKNLNKELKSNRDAVGLLDKVTGGAASKFVTFQKQLVGGFAAVKNLTKGMKLLKVAMISSGIGAIAVLVGAIAANWDKITGLLSGASLESQKLAETTKEIADAEQKKLDDLNGQEEILKLQGKSEEDILNMKKKQTDEVIAGLEAQLMAQEDIKKQQVDTAKRNQKILSGILKFISAPITAVLKAYDYITGSNTSRMFDQAASLIFDPEDVGEKADEQINKTKDRLAQLRNQSAGYQNSLNRIQQDGIDKRQKQRDDDAKKEQEEAERIAKEEQERLEKEQQDFEDFLKRKEEMEDEYFNSRLDKETQEKNAVADKYFALIEEAKKYGEDTSILEEARRQEMQDITDRYDQEELEKKKEADEKKRQQEEDLREQMRDIKEKAFDDAAKIAGEDSRLGKAIYAAKQILMAKENMLETKKTFIKAQQASKEASIEGAKSGSAVAQGTSETAKVGFPQNVPLLIAYALQAVGIIAAIKGAVKKTKKVTSELGGGGGGTDGGDIPVPTAPTPAVPQAPAFNIIGNSGTNQLADAMAQSSAQPFRSYVVSGDVTTSQELERNVITGASIG